MSASHARDYDVTVDSLSPDDFAKIALALASATDRAQVLASFGLDEDRWFALENEFQERLSNGLAAHPDDADGTPPEVEQMARAFSNESSRETEAPISFDVYVDITRAMQKGDVMRALESAKLDLPSYLRAHEYWVRAMTRDPALTQRFLDQLNRQGNR